MSAGENIIKRAVFKKHLAMMSLSDDLERCCGEYCGKNRVASFGILDILQFFENMIKIFFNAVNGFNTDKCRLKERTKVFWQEERFFAAGSAKKLLKDKSG